MLWFVQNEHTSPMMNPQANRAGLGQFPLSDLPWPGLRSFVTTWLAVLAYCVGFWGGVVYLVWRGIHVH